ncbi:MAG: hypothetical protein AAB516_00040 [Patescibacteria group bacterium]
MKTNLIPTTTLGKWSVGLNAFFLIAVGISCVLALVLKVLNFNDHWWDVTVAVAFPSSIIALIIGIIAVGKDKERSVLVNISIFVGVCTVLFILLHSLFIND